MDSFLIKKFGSVIILTVFFAVTVFWWMDKDFKSDGFTQDDLNEITEKLHGDLNSPVSASNAMSQARKKSHSERQRSKSKSKSLSEAEMKEILNKISFSSEDQNDLSHLKLQNPLSNIDINSDLDSLALINALGVRPSLRFDSFNNILSISGELQLSLEDATQVSLTSGILKLIDEHRALMGFGDNEKPTALGSIESNVRGESIIRVDRIYNDLPVWGRQLVITEKNGSVRSITGKFKSIPDGIDTTRRLDNSQLRGLVSSEFESYGPSYASFKSAERGIFVYSKIPMHAYKVIAEVSDGRLWEMYFDPNTGRLITKIAKFYDTSTPSSGTDLLGISRSFNSFFENNEYLLVDQSFPQPNETVVGTWNDGDPIFVRSNAPDSGWDAAGVSAMYNAKASYSYFFNSHSRNSFDGVGGRLIAIVNDSDLGANAYWQSGRMVYGDGGGVLENLAVAADVAAHEFSHGVVEYSSNLIYQNQSGALNESFADFFGAMVDRDDWYIGEDLYSGTNYLRSMANPASNGQPAHMDNFQNKPNTEEGDKGGVHINSGIPNKAFYLIADGLTAESLGTSIGKEKTEQLAYATLSKLSPDSEFIDAANTMILEAESVYGYGSVEYNSVTDAWASVGVTTSEVVTEGGSNIFSLANGDDLLVHLYPRDGSVNNLWDEEYNIYVQTINQPFEGHMPSLEVGPINDVPAKGSQVSVRTNAAGYSFVRYIGNDNKIREAFISTSSTDALMLDDDGINSVGSSSDGDKVALVFDNSNKIWVYDFNLSSWVTVTVVGPSYSTTFGDNPVKKVDAINFDTSGQKIIFDYLICRSVPDQAECENVWSIGIFDLGTSTFIYPFVRSNTLLDLGFPSFANTRNSVIAFDLVDWTEFSDNNKAVSRSIIYNLESNTITSAFQTNAGETRESAWGVPSFVGEDAAIALQSQDDDSTTMWQMSLDSDYQAIDDSALWLTPFQSAFGKGHRNAYRDIFARLETLSSTIDLGKHLRSEKIFSGFSITNNGNRELAITSIVASSSAVSTDLTNRILQPNETVSFKIVLNTSFAELGIFSENLSIRHSGDNATLQFGLSAYIDLDTDNDSVLNSDDLDDDGDGVPDTSDAFPLDPSESIDTDADGVGNNSDSDDDNDGLSDLLELNAGTNALKVDTDADSLSDKFEVDSNTRNPIKSDYDMAAGGSHNCVTQDDGVQCWGGDNSNSQLSAPASLIGEVQLDLGSRHSCAVKKGLGTVVCWGELSAERTPSGAGYTQIAAGGYHSCGIKDGAVVCAGSNGYGQTSVPVMDDALKVVAGNYHSCALTQSDVVCWGRDDDGRLLVPELVNPTNLYANFDVTCALDDNGLSCWGKGDSVFLTPPSFAAPSEVEIGMRHACAIDNDVISCWGENYQGNTSPPSISNPVQLAIGSYHSCALGDEGVICWGEETDSRTSVPSTLVFGDFDRDDLRDNIDTDDDGDGVADVSDAFPLDSTETIDTDSDGTGNNADTDDDNDSVLDVDDAFPLISLNGLTDNDSDGSPDDCDAACIELGMVADTDDDNDSVLDVDDAFPLDATESVDTDSDGIGNNADTDDDNDTVLDSDDAFPLDATETIDTDSDGTGNNADTDDDGDGVADVSDAFPLDSTETIDTDSDGTGNNADTDDDGDGVEDSADVYPLNSLYSRDSDGDGMPDAWEARYGLDPNDASDATSDQDNDGVTALDEFLAGTIPSGSLDIDGNENYDALTDGLLLLRGMFGLDGSALVTGTIASDAAYTESVDIESRIATLGELADIDGNGEIDALTDGLLTLRYLFGLQGDTLINGVVAEDATRKTAEEIEAHLETLMPAL